MVLIQNHNKCVNQYSEKVNIVYMCSQIEWKDIFYLSLFLTLYLSLCLCLSTVSLSLCLSLSFSLSLCRSLSLSRLSLSLSLSLSLPLPLSMLPPTHPPTNQPELVSSSEPTLHHSDTSQGLLSLSQWQSTSPRTLLSLQQRPSVPINKAPVSLLDPVKQSPMNHCFHLPFKSNLRVFRFLL